jgi:hypothetical protein
MPPAPPAGCAPAARPVSMAVPFEHAFDEGEERMLPLARRRALPQRAQEILGPADRLHRYLDPRASDIGESVRIRSGADRKATRARPLCRCLVPAMPRDARVERLYDVDGARDPLACLRM